MWHFIGVAEASSLRCPLRSAEITVMRDGIKGVQ